MLNRVLSACSTALGIASSVQVSPRRSRFCVVAQMGIERIEAALISFWVVRRLLGDVRQLCLMDQNGERYIFSYSQTAGRNFSWMSQMLCSRQYVMGIVEAGRTKGQACLHYWVSNFDSGGNRGMRHTQASSCLLGHIFQNFYYAMEFDIFAVKMKLFNCEVWGGRVKPETHAWVGLGCTEETTTPPFHI